MSPRSCSRDRRLEALPFVGEHLGDAELVVPGELGLGDGVDSAQDQRADPLGMGLGIGERQRRAPGAAEDEPSVDPGRDAQPLDVGDEIPGRVGLQAGVGRRAAAAALIEQRDVVKLGIEQAAMVGRDPAARAAMKEHRRPWPRAGRNARNRPDGRRRRRACRIRKARSADRACAVRSLIVRLRRSAVRP